MDDATIAVVDEHNRFLRWANRQEVHGQHLPHRSVHVLLFTPEGHWIVQQRRHDKLTWPGHWDVAVAGHVERDDYLAGPDDELDAVYAAVAAREVSEELGIAPVLELVGAFPPEPGVHYEHLRLYRGVHPGPFLIQPEEVAAVHPSTATTTNEYLADVNISRSSGPGRDMAMAARLWEETERVVAGL